MKSHIPFVIFLFCGYGLSRSKVPLDFAVDNDSFLLLYCLVILVYLFPLYLDLLLGGNTEDEYEEDWPWAGGFLLVSGNPLNCFHVLSSLFFQVSCIWWSLIFESDAVFVTISLLLLYLFYYIISFLGFVKVACCT